MHDGNSSRWRGALGVLCLSVALGSGCATTAPQRTGTLVFEPQQITGDLELSELNDEELFAAGTAAHGSEQWELAARAFDRIIDFHPDSPLVAKARFNAGLAYERLEDWERAHERYSSLADPERGEGDALEASFRAATMRYMLGDLEQAAALLDVLANRQDLPGERRLQALTERGVCEKDAGRLETAEATLREVLLQHRQLEEAGASPDVERAAQAQFHLAEIYRLHYEGVELDASQGVKPLARELDHKAELLLSAQGHYLRTIRLGHGEWAIAASAQVGALYENFWDALMSTPPPPELEGEAVEVYNEELRKKIRVLLTKAIGIYERTLETAVRIGAQNPYIERTRASLERMKALLVAETRSEQESTGGPASDPDAARTPAGQAPSSG
ncbi:MAG TPA: tetratricopeptide repeat protein [Myxococcaceae bacterium]|nr:tetratricopeptide repeat protein [Myxococcaceae bacterium]